MNPTTTISVEEIYAASRARREACEHRRFVFGSGNYYLFCRDCSARWVYSREDADVADACPAAARVLPGDIERRSTSASPGDPK